MTQDNSRARALREVLVQNVNSSPPLTPGPAPRPRGFGALVAASLIGALVGGGVTAAVAVGISSPETPDNVEFVTSENATAIKTQSAAFSLIGTHTPLVAEPVAESRAGSSSLELPPRPDGANMIAISLRCNSYGSVDLFVDGAFQAGTSCLEEPWITQGSGISTLVDPPTDGVLEFEAPVATLYTFWAGWVIAPETPTPSEAQLAEVADGVATEDEYRAAFGRFKACMGSAGHDLGETWVGTGYLYTTSPAAHEDGSDLRCYQTEFQDVDTLWQQAHSDGAAP